MSVRPLPSTRAAAGQCTAGPRRIRDPAPADLSHQSFTSVPDKTHPALRPHVFRDERPPCHPGIKENVQ